MSEDNTSQDVQGASNEVTPDNEQVNDSGSETTGDQKIEKSDETKSWEYNGDRKTVPPEFKKYATGFDQYISKKDQALAEANKKIKEYEQRINSSPSKDNQQLPNKGGNAEELSQDELDAIALGDPKAIQKLVDKRVQEAINSTVSPIAHKQRELEAAETIKAFSQINPDFQELLDSPVGLMMLDAASRGHDLETIYKNAKEAEAYFTAKNEAARKKAIEEKKAGSTVKGNVHGSPDVVYAENEDEAKRLAIQMQLKGDKRMVAVQPKKKR